MKDQWNNNLHQEGNKERQQVALPESSLEQSSTFPLASLEMLSSLLAFSPDALLLVDALGTIVLLNKQVETLFGYDRTELSGQLLEVLLPKRLRAGHMAQRLHYMNAPQARPMGMGLDLIGMRKDGSEFPIDVSLRPVLIGRDRYIVSALRDMTEQRQRELERIQLTELLRQQHRLINLSSDAILVISPDGDIRSWNRGAEELYGWKEQEVIGRVTFDLLSTRLPQPLETILQNLEQNGHWAGDLIHLCRDGREVIVESRWVLVRAEDGEPTAILEINRDVTESRRLERVEQEARAEMKARLDILQLILDRLSTGIFLVQGQQMRLILANRAAIDLLGAEWKQDQPLQDFVAQQHIRLASEDGRPLSLEHSVVNRVMQTGEPMLHHQQVIRRADGVSLPVMVDVIPLDLSHSFHRLPAEIAKLLTSSERVVLVVYQDVTVLKEAEALKDQFVSLATHELRTPVTVLAGYADLLLKHATKSEGQELDPAQRSKLLAMKEATHHLTRLTEDLLDVTRVQAGQFELHRSLTDLISLTRELVRRIQTTTDRHRLSLQTALGHLQASVDALRVDQVLSNLLTNAVKYSPQGGDVTVTIWQDQETGEACFGVRDSGMGIPKEEQARIFGRFVRAENARSACITGTGLGLYLCRELVERHGGHIWFESRENQGSTFFFTLPCDISGEAV